MQGKISRTTSTPMGKKFLFPISMAMSPLPSKFAPLVFTGRLEEGLKALAEAGFSGVELSLRHANDLDEGWLASRLQEFGLRISAFATGRMCLEDELCLSDLDPSVQAKVQAEIGGVLELAGRFKAPVIIGGVRGRLSGDADQQEKQRTAAVASLRLLAGVAEDLGTFLLLEPINRYETNFINSAAEGLSFIQSIGHPAIKLLLDTFHMNIEEADLVSAIREAGPRLSYVHFADSNRLAPGRGHIDFSAVIKALMEIGYTGFITGEVLPIPDDTTALIQTRQYLQILLQKLEDYP